VSLADAVAALPGGGEFAELWTQVNGDPGAISDIATKVKSSADKAEESAHKISRTAGEVGDAWHGQAAEAFAGYMNHFGAAAGSVHAAMGKAATAIQQAGTAVEQAKHQLNSIASRILDRAQQLAPLQHNHEDPNAYTAAVEQAVSEGCAEARPIVSQLAAHLEQAASTVHACVASGGFVAMKAANSGTYLPAPGKPIRWNPVPHGLDPGTSPQSASGGYGGGSSSGYTGASSGVASGGPPTAPPSGNVASWIKQAEQLLIKSGVPASKISADDINIIIQHESAGNPHAENNWDSNAAAGHPSKGLMQTIDSTFNSYALPGHTDIWNPVDNIVAGVRYALSRYGSLDAVPGVAAVHSGGSYVGY
jgi:WXG100 family type VII secretion target